MKVRERNLIKEEQELQFKKREMKEKEKWLELTKSQVSQPKTNISADSINQLKGLLQQLVNEKQTRRSPSTARKQKENGVAEENKVLKEMLKNNNKILNINLEKVKKLYKINQQ